MDPYSEERELARSWLEPMLDPSDFIRRRRGRRRTTLADGLAHLMEGRLADYVRLSKEHNLPQFGPRWDRSFAPEWGLIATVTRHLSGEPDAPPDYEEVAADRRSGSNLKTTALILAAVGWSDYGNSARAVEVLAHASREARGLDLCLLLLHEASHLVERGEVAAAASTLAKAESLANELPRTRIGIALRVVLAHNAFALGFRVGTIRDPATLPSRTQAHPLVHIDALLAEGLEHHLEAQFEAAYKDPYDRSFTWRSQDPVEAPLSGALLQSEVWADHFSLQRARKVVGRYRILSAAGVTNRQPESGFELLRRARDSKGIRKAVGLYRRVGPELPLRNLATAAASSEWLLSEEETVLELLRGVAEFLPEEVAQSLVRRLLGDEPLFARAAPRVLDALSQVVQVAPRKQSDLVARRTLHWVTTHPHPLVAISAGRLLRSLAWDAVSRETRRDWIQFVEQHVGESTDLGSVSESAALGLAQRAPKDISRSFVRAYRRSPNLMFAAVLADMDASLDERTLASLTVQLNDALRSARSDAHEGRYSGLTVDVALLATWVASRTGNDATWQAIADFILDPKVAASQKASAMDSLSEAGRQVPRPIARVLEQQLKDTTAYAGPMLGPSEAFEGARLRLGLKVGVFSEKEAVAALISMARGSATARVEALRTMEVVRFKDSTDLVATLTVALAGDENQDVSAYAVRVLGILAGGASGPVQSVIRDVIETALQSPGSIVRRGALEGLYRANVNGRLLTSGVRRDVQGMAQSDLSASVRFAAHRVLQRHAR